MFTIHHGKLITTLVDAHGRIRYTIESRTANERWISSIRSVAQSRSLTGDAPDFWYEEVARVEWRSQGTLISFGARKISASSYLKREKRFTNSRIFIGSRGELFRWKIKGGGLELHHEPSGAIVACSHPSCQGMSLLSIKSRPASLDVITEYSKVPQVLDEIVITWVIVDGMMHNKDLDNSC